MSFHPVMLNAMIEEGDDMRLVFKDIAYEEQHGNAYLYFWPLAQKMCVKMDNSVPRLVPANWIMA